MNASMILAGIAGLAAVAGIVGVVLGLAQRDIPFAVVSVVAGLTTAALLYAAGEGLEALHRIERNTRARAQNTEAQPPVSSRQNRRRAQEDEFEFPDVP